MKIEKRYIVGGLMLIPFLPVFLLGFVFYWVELYAASGYDIGQEVCNWIERTLNKGEKYDNDDWNVE